MQKGTNGASTPIEAWRARSFDDTAWPQAPSLFHFGESSVTGGTVLSDMRNKYTGIFLRHPFSISQPSDSSSGPDLARRETTMASWLGSTEPRWRVIW